MGTIFVDNIKQQSSQGSVTITIGASGETVALASGVTGNVMTPAFIAKGTSSNQTFSLGTDTKVQFPTVILDTNSGFDNTTNYRYTIPSGLGGVYHVSIQGALQCSTAYFETWFRLFTNGTSNNDCESRIRINADYLNAGSSQRFSCSSLISLSAGDYIEVFAYIHSSSGGTPQVNANSQFFSAYRVGNS